MVKAVGSFDRGRDHGIRDRWVMTRSGIGFFVRDVRVQGGEQMADTWRIRELF
jgi:hypothetical protein